jgi:outer membrane lipoprotein-sorting protein
MKQIKGYLLVLVMIFSGYGFQSGGDDFIPMVDVKEFKKALENFSTNTKSIQSEFIQEKQLSILEEKISSKGSFSFQRENSVRWEYTEPIQYAIIIRNEKFSIKDGDKVNSYDVNSNLLFKQINRIIISMVSGNLPSGEEFDLSYFENKDLYQVSLVPVREEVEDMISSIQIFQSKKDLTVVKVRLTESNGDYTVLHFQNTILNAEIPVETFLVK